MQAMDLDQSNTPVDHMYSQSTPSTYVLTMYIVPNSPLYMTSVLLTVVRVDF
jgi:hypothetical protein